MNDQTAAMDWTKPYHGIRHLLGLKRGWQVTVCDYGDCADVWIKPPGTFAECAMEWHNSVDEACAAGERMAREHHCIA